MIVMIGSLSVQDPAQADIIRLNSKISEINTESNYLTTFRLDPQTEKTEEIKIDLDEATQFYGVASLRELKKGDAVTIEANYNAFSHEWKALVIGPVTANVV